MYTQGLPRHYSRLTKEDFFQKELQHIGQQEVLNKEVKASHANPDDVFGYVDRYREYTEQLSSVHGKFRDELDYWHMAREFATDPTLNGSFIEATPTTRIFADQTIGDEPVLAMVKHSIQARRMVSAANKKGEF